MLTSNYGLLTGLNYRSGSTLRIPSKTYVHFCWRNYNFSQRGNKIMLYRRVCCMKVELFGEQVKRTLVKTFGSAFSNQPYKKYAIGLSCSGDLHRQPLCHRARLWPRLPPPIWAMHPQISKVLSVETLDFHVSQALPRVKATATNAWHRGQERTCGTRPRSLRRGSFPKHT